MNVEALFMQEMIDIFLSQVIPSKSIGKTHFNFCNAEPRVICYSEEAIIEFNAGCLL